MANLESGESDSLIDLESGEAESMTAENTGEDDETKDLNSSNKFSKKMLGRLRSGNLGLVRPSRIDDFEGLHLGKSLLNLGETLDIFASQEGEKASGSFEKRMSKEKRKKTSSKKPPKPPRPPRGPSLDEADMKLVRENLELSRLRRARREHIKAVKKMRTDKASSSNNANLFAIVITILFFVIIFQGILGSHV